jgi:PAS domain S-box-containing protein
MRLLVATSGELGHGNNLRVSLARALDCLRGGIGSTVCTVWLIRPDGSTERVAYAGLTREYLDAHERLPRDVIRKVILERGRDVLMADGEAVRHTCGPGFDAPYTLLNLRSVCVVPLVTPNYQVGVLMLGHHEQGWFSRHSLEFYRSLGAMLANAIDNARLFEELRRSEGRQSGVLRAVLDGIGCLDARARFTEVNPAIELLLGLPRERIVGRRLVEFVPREHHGALREVQHVLLTPGSRVSGVRLSVTNVRGERVPLVANGSPLHGDDGQYQGVVFVVQDERERLATERRERAAVRSLELMLQHLAEGVALVDAGGERIHSCNAAFARLLGSTGRELEGRSLAEVFPQYDSSGCASLVRGAATHRANRTASDLAVLPPGRDREFWTLTAAPLQEFDEGRRLVLLTVTDQTSRRQIDERLRQSQKLAAVGTLAGGIAHEYNNLLTAILGHLSIALADLPDDHPLAAGLRDSEAAALRAAELTQQLLGFGRRSPLDPRPTTLGPVIEHLLGLVRRTFDPRIDIVTEFDDELWTVRADANRFSEALMHLCLNARDAMGGGGRLTLSVRNARLDPRGGTPAGDYVRVDVRDTGVGMPPEVLARMYEPFYTTKGAEGGTGLGLATVHGIVEQHHGWIECESAPGGGTCFSVFVPRWKGREPAEPAPAHATVLVVDDEPAVRSLARLVLERRGHQVTEASDGQEALERVERGERPDLILLDLTMPRLSGADTLRRLRGLAPGTRVVLTTGYGAVSAMEAGQLADAFLPKPFTPDQLAELVRELLEIGR